MVTVDRNTAIRQAPPERGAWETTITGWHYALWGSIALGFVNALTRNELSLQERLLATVLLLTLLVAYQVLVVRHGRNTRQTAGYLVVAIGCVGLACAIDPTFALLLFIVYPQAWLFTPTLRLGSVTTLALTVWATVGLLVGVGFTRDHVLGVVPQMLVSLGFSLLLGWWISRIIEQSRDRAELIAELERTRTELAEANHQAGVSAERERMAREIHDTLAQGFTSVLMLAQAARARPDEVPAPVDGRLAAIEDVARQNLAEARSLVASFTPADLDGAELPEAVRRLTTRFARQHATEVDTDIADDVRGLDRAAEVVLLRAVQEALSNIARHARADHVRVRLAGGESDGTYLEVADDGVGFDPASVEVSGLAMMRRRAAEVGGTVTVTGTPGRGTRIEVVVPVRSSAAEEVP